MESGLSLRLLIRWKKDMKNVLRLVLIIIGLIFIVYGFYNLLVWDLTAEDIHQQLFAMMGVGALFLIGGLAMGKK